MDAGGAGAHRTRASTSVIGLNAANFFVAGIVGVTLPFLNDLLRERGWHYDAIGLASSTLALGVFLFQTPAGLIVDRARSRPTLLAVISVTLGISFGLIPVAAYHRAVIYPLLLFAGAGQAFLQPLLGALALGLAGFRGMNRMMAQNQAWNHGGNITTALLAMLIATVFGADSVFIAVFASSLLAAASVKLISARDSQTAAAPGGTMLGSWGSLLRDRRAIVLLVATGLFHLAHAPVVPMLALDVKRLHGTHAQVAAVVLVAQTVMVPVAYLAGTLGERFGRKPVMLCGFIILPVRVFLYSLTDNPSVLLALQSLDGIGSGLYSVLIPSMCADLTARSGGFTTLLGMIATVQSLGAVIGPLGSGFVIEHLGFATAFDVIASIAVVAAVLFCWKMPETRPRPSPEHHALAAS